MSKASPLLEPASLNRSTVFQSWGKRVGLAMRKKVGRSQAPLAMGQLMLGAWLATLAEGLTQSSA